MRIAIGQLIILKRIKLLAAAVGGRFTCFYFIFYYLCKSSLKVYERRPHRTYVAMYNHMQHGNDPRTQGKEFNTKDEMETFMVENSRKDGVELASYVFKNKNGEYKYFVQPWDKNLADKSTNYQSFIDQYVNQGYYVEAQIHTHLTSFPSMPGLSSIDMEFFHSSGIKSIYCIEPNCYYYTSRDWMAPIVYSDGKNRTYGFKINSLPFP